MSVIEPHLFVDPKFQEILQKLLDPSKKPSTTELGQTSTVVVVVALYVDEDN